MSVLIKGLVIHNTGKTSVALTEVDGPQTFSPELEAQLVSEGVAVYVSKSGNKSSSKKSTLEAVATTPEKTLVQDQRVNKGEEESSVKSKIKPLEKPEYNKDMKLAELREIMDSCQIPYKVGMSKSEIIAVLDEYFDETFEDEVIEDEAMDDYSGDEGLPDLDAEEPII